MNLNLPKKQLFVVFGVASLALSIVLIYMFATNAAKPIKTTADPLTTCLNSKMGTKSPLNNPFSNYVIFECYQKQSRYILASQRATTLNSYVNMEGNQQSPATEIVASHQLLTAGDLAFFGTYPDGSAGRNLYPVRMGAAVGNSEVVMENPATGTIEKINLGNTYPGSSSRYAQYFMFGRDIDQIQKFSSPVTLTATSNANYVKFVKKFLSRYGEGDLSCPNTTLPSSSIYSTGLIDLESGTYNENLKKAIVGFKDLNGLPVITSTGFNYNVDLATWQRIEQIILNEVLGMG